MMTQRKINIPIFDYKLTIVIFDKWEEVEHLFDGGPEPRAITKTRYGASLVAINSKKGDSIIHEAEHIKNAIWSYIGYSPQRDNDEVDAYLIAYIYKKIIEVYSKHDKSCSS
jgi:hypothetical protein|nr:MAG TPA: hypothetical protein [Crassvirales sp.]